MHEILRRRAALERDYDTCMNFLIESSSERIMMTYIHDAVTVACPFSACLLHKDMSMPSIWLAGMHMNKAGVQNSA